MGTDYLFLKISGFAYVIPVLVGVVYWKCLTKPLKIYWLWHVVASISVILVIMYGEGATRFTIERGLITVVMEMVMGWFCIELFQKRSEKIAIGIWYGAFISYNLYDWMQYVSYLHYNRMSIAGCALAAASTFILLRKVFAQEGNRHQKPIFLALTALFIENCLTVLLFTFSDMFESYSSSRWYAVLWFEVYPVSNLIFISMATYALYLSGQTQRNLGKIPELEAVEGSNQVDTTPDLKQKNH